MIPPTCEEVRMDIIFGYALGVVIGWIILKIRDAGSK